MISPDQRVDCSNIILLIHNITYTSNPNPKMRAAKRHSQNMPANLENSAVATA